MALEAIQGNKSSLVNPIKAEKNPAEIFDKENVKTEAKKTAEIMLFASKAKYSQEVPKITLVSKSIAETSQAAVSSTKPAPALFQMNDAGRIVATTANASATPTLLSSALASTENNKGSGDKKDEGRNLFVSAKKSTQDLRKEKLDALTDLENASFLSMMKGLC